jgi:hypothetical protein
MVNTIIFIHLPADAMTLSRHATFEISQLENLKNTVNSDDNPIIYLSIDPGKYNGVCGYDARYYPMFMYVVDEKDITEFIHSFEKVKLCVLEDFKLFPNKSRSQIYSDMPTSRVIGRVEDWTKLKKIELIKQPSNIKATGYAWIGKKPPAKHTNKNDPMDAHVHFMFWAVKNGKIPASKLLNDGQVS